MRRASEILVVFITIIIASCGTGDQKVKSSKLIPARNLVPLLTDLYLADGLLSYQPVKNIFIAKDSIINYVDVIEKHGYTKEQMDNTLKYYFTNNPKKLQKIYDQVLARLTEMESELESNSPSPNALYNLWNQKPSLKLPEEGVHNPLFFSIPVKDTGMYTFNFDYVIYTDDQSLNPRTTIYFWRSDSTATGIKEPWDDIRLIRDGLRHSCSVTRRLTDKSFTHISGNLHECDPQSARWEKHAIFSNMLLIKGKTE